MLTRRAFARNASALGATAVWAGAWGTRKRAMPWTERRDLFPQGVADAESRPREARIALDGAAP